MSCLCRKIPDSPSVYIFVFQVSLGTRLISTSFSDPNPATRPNSKQKRWRMNPRAVFKNETLYEGWVWAQEMINCFHPLEFSAFLQHSLIILASFSFTISHLLQFVSILTIFSYTCVTESASLTLCLPRWTLNFIHMIGSPGSSPFILHCNLGLEQSLVETTVVDYNFFCLSPSPY